MFGSEAQGTGAPAPVLSARFSPPGLVCSGAGRADVKDLPVSCYLLPAVPQHPQPFPLASSHFQLSSLPVTTWSPFHCPGESGQQEQLKALHCPSRPWGRFCLGIATGPLTPVFPQKLVCSRSALRSVSQHVVRKTRQCNVTWGCVHFDQP